MKNTDRRPKIINGINFEGFDTNDTTEASMTICIAAICEKNGKEHVVFATDHMITAPSGQFEHSITKFKELDENTIAMLSGQALLFDSLIKISKKNLSFEKKKEEIFTNIRNKREESIKNELLSKYGIEKTVLLNALAGQIPNPFINTMLLSLAEYELKTLILLIGFDKGVCQISEISEYGIVDFRDINFHAIGSGAGQAINTLLFQRHSKTNDIKETLYNVYKAKRNAEVAGGVGRETDVLVLCKDKKPKNLKKAEIEILESIYQRELNFGKKQKQLKKIDLDRCCDER